MPNNQCSFRVAQGGARRPEPDESGGSKRRILRIGWTPVGLWYLRVTLQTLMDLRFSMELFEHGHAPCGGFQRMLPFYTATQTPHRLQ